MNKHNASKLNSNLILAAALIFGATATLRAQTPANQAPPPGDTSASTATAQASPGYGLIGQNYTTFDFAYVRHLDGPPNVEHDYGFGYNQALVRGLDFTAAYDWLTAGGNGFRNHRQNLTGGLTAYLPMDWGKPFVSGQAGWSWSRFNGNKDDEFLGTAAAGVEFQVAQPLAVAPYASYEEYRRSYHVWNYGLRTTYRLNHDWSATLDPQIDEHNNITYQAGLNLHF